MSTKNFWDERYQSGKTGWNIGYVSTPLKTYFDQLTNKDLKILIPGTGNSYEAEYLFNHGFKQVFVADISAYPLQNLKKRVPGFPDAHLLNQNFFELEGTYDLIIEQTFFCALSPELRIAYRDKMVDLLKPNGKLVGLLFNFPLSPDGPPYGGDEETYQKLFSPSFAIKTLETAYNSISPRTGRELFFIFQKEEN